MDVFVAGLPLIAVVLALVEWFKKINIPSVALPYVSMAVGVLVGIAYQLSQKPLILFSDWFGAVVFGLAYGLMASGIYDAGKSITRNPD